MPKEFWSLFN